MREVWADIIHTSGAKIYSMVVGVIVLSITARLLGPEGRGQIAAITTWVTMFALLSGLSLGQVALHHMAEDQERQRFGAQLGSLLLLALVLTICGWLVAFGFSLYKAKDIFKGLSAIPLLIGFLAMPFMLWDKYGSSLLMGLGRIRIYNRYLVIGRTLSVLAVLAFVGMLGLGVTGALTANLIGQAVVALGSLGVLFAYANRKRFLCWPTKWEAKSLLSGGMKLHLNAVGSVMFTSANILILNYFYGAKQTAYFQLDTQLLGMLMIIPQAASMSFFGKVTTLGPNGAWPMNRRLLIQLTLGMIFLGGISALLAPWGITLLAGESFMPAVAPFQWMVLGLIGMAFSNIMAPQWIGRGYFWQTAGLTVFIGTINLGANFWLIPKLGIWGAVYAFLGTYAFSMLGNGLMALHCQLQFNKAFEGSNRARNNGPIVP